MNKPLSALVQEMDHKGEVFIPLVKLVVFSYRDAEIVELRYIGNELNCTALVEFNTKSAKLFLSITPDNVTCYDVSLQRINVDERKIRKQLKWWGFDF